jgi:F-type H+-transporting ATPase subunit delta
MSNQRIAIRYAEAFMSAAEELQMLEKVSEDFLQIKKLLGDSHDFLLFLKSPVIKKEKKQQVLDAVFGKLIQPLTLKFLAFLAEKERENVLPAIIDSFFDLQDEKMGIVRVHVKSAAEFSEEQMSELKKRFEAYSKKKVRIDISIDKKLIGGFIAHIGDTMLDGSIKRQLELLRIKFAGESVPL